MWIWKNFGIENYGWKVSLTQKIFVNFDNFLYDFWSPNCVDTSRPKFFDILRLKFVYSSSK